MRDYVFLIAAYVVAVPIGMFGRKEPFTVARVTQQAVIIAAIFGVALLLADLLHSEHFGPRDLAKLLGVYVAISSARIIARYLPE